MMEKWYNVEDISMNDECRVISEFCCCGKPMVTVRSGDAAHVMTL